MTHGIDADNDRLRQLLIAHGINPKTPIDANGMPQLSGYWRVRPKNADDTLDGKSYEIVYLMFDGRWRVMRCGSRVDSAVDQFVWLELLNEVSNHE